ncbi:dienelactone hydrolase family protein [Paraconexibacter antarcticus]|uniref:Dienelactone hydrolase family protein n=1 Tax=Paraconexibacter antarcticus TaxID=2949664 RepID=A0ABY5DZR8_9ACTN|nr:dienelactone hydrolase family protein [Paraconexibacter antarcticus]
MHDALGLSDDIRSQADRLAASGYLALAPDLYAGDGLRCVLATLQASRSGGGRAYQHLEAARRSLSERPDCNGRVGIIGFCMGGGFAVHCAPQYEFQAASVNYGEVPKDAVERLRGACPIVASFGRRDLTLRGRAERLEHALTTLGIPHDIKEYPDAGHSFLNHIGGGPVIGTLLRVTHFDYHEPSADDAWSRIVAFFDEHLRNPRARTPTDDGEDRT